TQLYEEALVLNEKSKNPLWKANHLASIALCLAEDGYLDRAIDFNSNAFEIREKIGDLGGIAANRLDEAMFVLESGNPARARQLAEQANDMAQDIGRASCRE